MNPVKILLFMLFVALSMPAAASELAAAGRVKTAVGSAVAQRDGQKFLLKVGDKIFAGDTLETGKDSALGIILRDNTSFSLGASSSIVIDSYVFAPERKKFSFVTRMTRGIVAFISGKMSKLAPEAVQFKTPMATIAIRGTKFLVKVEDSK